MVEGQDGTGWRLRQPVRLDVPLGKPGSPQAVLWAEPFVGLNRTGWGQDRLRPVARLSRAGSAGGQGISVEAAIQANTCRARRARTG
jgi:hypothetical protein